jgi:RNA polymerase sigma factor (sigma-70 family)
MNDPQTPAVAHDRPAPARRRFTNSLTPEERGRLVTENTALAIHILKKFHLACPLRGDDYQDALCEAMAGLVEAAHRWRQDGRDFGTYAGGVIQIYLVKFITRHRWSGFTCGIGRPNKVASLSAESKSKGRGATLANLIAEREGPVEWTEAEWDDLLSALGPFERKLIRMVYRDGLTTGEIVRRLEKPHQIIIYVLRSALDKLREQFGAAWAKPVGSHPATVRLGPSTHDAIRRLHGEGKTDAQIAQELGIRRRQVTEARSQILRLPTNPDPNRGPKGRLASHTKIRRVVNQVYGQEVLERVKELRGRGLRDWQIAEELDLSEGAVAHIRKQRLGLPANAGPTGSATAVSGAA